MIPLKTHGIPRGVCETVLGRVRASERTDCVTVVDVVSPFGWSSAPRSIPLSRGTLEPGFGSGIESIDSLAHLAHGDVVAVHPSGRVDTLFRVGSANNSLFATERCNSRCLMCSQPPRAVDDMEYFLTLNRALIGLLPATLPTLGMTGGEPTLLGARLCDLLKLVATTLPQTQFEILSNGRAFSRSGFADQVGQVSTEKVLFSIPLYSDYPPQHDFVVQARDAFAQTVIGLHNLARFGVRSEIRVVLHRQTSARLPALARFIHKNLPFVEHVALMGMEHTGYARLHDDILWIEPELYSLQVEQAVEYLTMFGFHVSVYNLQHCLVPRSIWPHLRPSISDWKREYLPECESCAMREQCGGLFGTSHRQSQLIRPIHAS